MILYFSVHCPAEDNHAQKEGKMKTMDKKESWNISRFFLGVLFAGVLVLGGCRLTINSFLAPDTVDTGTVITFTLQGYAEDISDNDTLFGLVLQIPDTWTVLSAKVTAPIGMSLAENPTYEPLYTPEAGYQVWVGTGSTHSGENQTITFAVKVLVGEFTGLIGDVESFTVKAATGVYRDGAWNADDPEGIFDFADITGEPHVEEILVTKVLDETAPAMVTTLAVTDLCNGMAQLSWSGYDEEGQGDVVHYNIYQDTSYFNDISAKTPVTTVPLGTFWYRVNSLSYGTEYHFAVTAVDELGQENSEVISQSIIPQEGGTISGRITGNEYGDPLGGIQIDVYDHSSGQYVAGTSTDFDGTYSISNVCPGTYSVKADGGEIYATEWYDNRSNSQDADMVTVESGQITSGIDFILTEFCKADFDDDGDVDGFDMAFFAAEVGRVDCPCAEFESGAVLSSTEVDEIQGLQNEILSLRTELAAKERRLQELVDTYTGTVN